MLRRLASALGLVLLTVAPASAYLVEVTTSVSVADSGDERVLHSALRTAVDSVLKGAIAFKPTLIVLTNATVVGDRLYVRLLLADQEGERTFDELNAPNESDTTELHI